MLFVFRQRFNFPAIDLFTESTSEPLSFLVKQAIRLKNVRRIGRRIPWRRFNRKSNRDESTALAVGDAVGSGSNPRDDMNLI